MKTIKVKSCRNCPFCEHNYHEASLFAQYAHCLAPPEIRAEKYKVDSYFKNYSSPKFCPLNKHSLKIEKV